MTKNPRMPLTNPFTLACVAVLLLFGPSDGNAAQPLPVEPGDTPAMSQQSPAAGLLDGQVGPSLLKAFCSRSADEFADYAPLLTTR